MLKEHTYELVGNTPLIRLRHIEQEFDLKCQLYAKVELFNPAGSIKDRIALEMIEDAEEKGLLNDESVIIEPTSGNTGIGIASICAMKGYRCILTMPSSMSIERRKLLKAYGAELVLTDASLGMKGAIAEAESLKKEIPHSIILGQFTNPANPMAHYKTTGPEIYEDLDGLVDVFVAGIGTGGTISGVGRFLKERIGGVKIIGVEPASSAVISGNPAGPHKIQGIGAGFIPETLDLDVVDEISPISNEDAFEFGRLVSNLEGFLVGISSGAALAAAAGPARRGGSDGPELRPGDAARLRAGGPGAVPGLFRDGPRPGRRADPHAGAGYDAPAHGAGAGRAGGKQRPALCRRPGGLLGRALRGLRLCPRPDPRPERDALRRRRDRRRPHLSDLRAARAGL